MTIRIYGYKPGSRGAAALAEALGARVLRHEGSVWRPRLGDTVINWGSTADLRFDQATIMNPPELVRIAGNKLSFFQYVFGPESQGGVPRIPDFTTDRVEAQNWLNRGHIIVCRMSLTGHSGHGIIIVSGQDTLPEAPLYVKYVKKDSEYRVHIFDREVIDLQRKVRDPDREPLDWKVRSHSNGFIFQRNNINVPQDVLEQARRAFVVSGLDFGAIDVIWNRNEQQAYVLEINTAPGLEGSTVPNYANAFRRLIG